MAKKVIEQLEQGRTKKEAQYVTTGNTLRDLMIGGGEGLGYKVGKIYNIVGTSSAGKTFVAVQSIAANYFKLGNKFVWNYDDGESGFSFDSNVMYGMDKPFIDEETLTSHTVEDLYNNVRKFSEGLKKDQIGMYVIDSLDGLSSLEVKERGDARYKKFEEGKEYDDDTMGMGKTKFLSREFFTDISSRIVKKNIVFVIISQVRDNVGAGKYERKDRRNGGRALDFYCHTVEWIRGIGEKSEMLDDGTGLRSGRPIKSVNEKSKTARPMREAHMVLDFSIGIDDIAGNVDYLYNLRTDTGNLRGTKKNKINWDDKLFERNELCDYIYDNQLEEELAKLVIDKWEKADKGRWKGTSVLLSHS